MLIEELLEEAVSKGASDIHISSNLPPVFRIDGQLIRTSLPPLTSDNVETLVFPILNNEQRRRLEQDWELDMSYGIHGIGRFRVNIYKDRGNYAAAFRVIASQVPSFKELGLSDTVRKIAENYKLPYYTISPTYSVCKDHGYIAGEQYTCPYCGNKTEVYSRITGYYRPVQNWNDGKTQEFKERKEYDIAVSSLHVKKEGEGEAKQVLLFTTKTCPNCPAAKNFLDKAGIKYVAIDAQEHPELVKKYGIMQAPTLVVVSGEKVDKIAGAPQIKEYAKN